MKTIYNNFYEIYNHFFSLIKNSSNILLAFSGGPDSTLCFLILLSLKQKYNIKFGVIVINHKFNIEGFYQEENYIQNLCKTYEIPYYIKYLTQEIHYKNNQNLFRNFRWEKFILTAYEYNYDGIITGHNLEDNVDTFLMRIGKASGPWGLKSIEIEKNIYGIKIIKPLLYTPRQVIESLMKNYGYFQDKTGKNNDGSYYYQRNGVRSIHKNLENNGINIEEIHETIKKYYDYWKFIIFNLPNTAINYNYIVLKNFEDYDKVLQWHWINYYGRYLKYSFDLIINNHYTWDKNIVIKGLWFIKNKKDLIITYVPTPHNEKSIAIIEPNEIFLWNKKKIIKNNTNRRYWITTVDNFYIPIHKYSMKDISLKNMIPSMIIIYNEEFFIMDESLILKSTDNINGSYHYYHQNFLLDYIVINPLQNNLQ